MESVEALLVAIPVLEERARIADQELESRDARGERIDAGGRRE